MEAVIHQFKLVSEGIHPPAGELYQCVESARGELGYYLGERWQQSPLSAARALAFVSACRSAEKSVARTYFIRRGGGHCQRRSNFRRCRSLMLSEKTRQAILELQKLYPEKRSALIPALHLAQAEVGYLPRETQNEVAELFEIDPNEVNAVVTFYDMFFEKPVGKHLDPCLQKCLMHAAWMR